jgi:hypothetical protein
MTIAEMHILFKVFMDKVDSSAYSEILREEIDIFLNEAQDRFIKTRYNINNIYGKGFEESQKRIDDLKGLVKTRYCAVTTVPYYSDVNVVRTNLNTLYEDEALTIPVTDEYMFFLKGLAHSVIANCSDEWRKLKLVQQDDIASITSDPFNRPLRGKPVMFFEDGEIMVWAHDDVVVDNFLVTFLKKPRIINSITTQNHTIQLTVNVGDVTVTLTVFDGDTSQDFSVVGTGLTPTQIATDLETDLLASGLNILGTTVSGGVLTIQGTPEMVITNTVNISSRDLGQAGDCELSEHTHREIVQMAVAIALENIEAQRVQTQELLNIRKIE